MLNDYLSDLHFWETLGLIMFGSILLWSIFSGISSLIQHWRRPERPDAPAPLPADDREDFIPSCDLPSKFLCFFKTAVFYFSFHGDNSARRYKCP